MPFAPSHHACPHCGAEVPSGSHFCAECGSDEATGWADPDEIDGIIALDGIVLPDEEPAPERADSRGARWMATVVVVALMVGSLVLIASGGSWLIASLVAVAVGLLAAPPGWWRQTPGRRLRRSPGGRSS